MNQKELRELIEFLIEKDITEFELERGDIRVRVKRGGEVQYVSAPVAAAPQPVAEPAAQARPASSASTTGQGAPPPKAVSEEEGLHLVRSPLFHDRTAPPVPPSAAGV